MFGQSLPLWEVPAALTGEHGLLAVDSLRVAANTNMIISSSTPSYLAIL